MWPVSLSEATMNEIEEKASTLTGRNAKSGFNSAELQRVNSILLSP